jgi:hypothetical protein
MDYSTIQSIANGVVEASAACDGQLFTGTVTSANPLKITLGEDAGGIELDGDDIILTQAVVSKKLYIKKHDHTDENALTDTSAMDGMGLLVNFIPAGVDPSQFPINPDTGLPDIPGMGTTLSLQHKHVINTNTLEAWVTEYGTKLPFNPSEHNPDGEQIVVTINRGLEKGDKVIMTRVSHGQQFIVLSRYFEVDKQGEDDN